jgi:cysteinyl-tRNA synthetase
MAIYDSLSSSFKIHPSPSQQQLGAAWYICGPTVYDSAHLGHGRTYVLLDILRRVAINLHKGSASHLTPPPLYVMNVTDVDDKIIQRSMENASQQSTTSTVQEADPLSLARHFEAEFWQDMDRLNVLRPDIVCRVSEHVESTIVPYIEQILKGGMAYVIPEGDDNTQQNGSVYFDVRAFESLTNGRTKYGKLAPDVASSDFFSLEAADADENNSEGQHVSLIRKKRDPRDFCLWKYRSRTQNNMSTVVEPASVSFKSPWGFGRPGWHVECSAMIQRLAEDFSYTHQFQLHAGGIDLKFPHHSNEIAQAEAYGVASNAGNSNEDWKEWIPHWVHTGHLYVKGRKMSKSLKNFVTIREMLKISDDTETMPHAQQNEWSSPADDFRLWCLGLSGSYRGPATYSKDRMTEACVIREKWVRFLVEGQECLERWASDQQSSASRRWGNDELELFRTTTLCHIQCHQALLGTSNESGSKGSFDLDGSAFVKEITSMIDEGMRYVEQVKRDRAIDATPRPIEALSFTVNAVRGLLELVGFTKHTFNAGVASSGQLGVAPGDSTKERALLDEIVEFRASVRALALNGIRQKDGMSAVKDVLQLCDRMRDISFPSLGVEILDGKATDAERGGWRYCSPHERSSEEK